MTAAVTAAGAALAPAAGAAAPTVVKAPTAVPGREGAGLVAGGASSPARHQAGSYCGRDVRSSHLGAEFPQPAVVCRSLRPL